MIQFMIVVLTGLFAIATFLIAEAEDDERRGS